MLSRAASRIHTRRRHRTVAALIVMLGVVSACSKESALPTAPSPSTETPLRLSIEGVVRQRADGHGLPGARVEIAEGTNQGTQVSADDAGRYRLNDLEPGALTLRAVADGYAVGTQTVTLSTNQTLDFTLDQAPGTPPPAVQRFTLSGSVSDSRDESAIRGARVRVLNGPDAGLSTIADRDGRFSLSVQPASITVEASASGYNASTRQITVSGTQVIDLVLESDTTPPPGPTPPAGPLASGLVVNAVSQESVSGALVRVDGGGEATSGPDGAFQVAVASPTATAAVSITSGLTVERVTRIRPTGPATITLIPKSINVAAFDQMFRPDGILRRWTEAPAIVVQRRVLEFTNLDATTFTATDTLLSDAEVDSIVDDLQRALSDLTGGAIDRFANQTVETAEEGQTVSVARTGVIVVAEYRGLTDATTFWGYTRWAWNERGELRAASMMLDRAFETSGSRHRQTLRTHELGHALGYSHVDARSSVMNVSARVALTGFDRDGARIAFQRPPLNMSPDIDPDPMTVNRGSTALTWKGAQ